MKCTITNRCILSISGTTLAPLLPYPLAIERLLTLNAFLLKGEPPMSRSKPPTLETLLRRFLSELEVANASPYTQSVRRNTLDKFLRWCHERGIELASEITFEILQAYQRYLFHYTNPHTGKKITPETQANYLRSVKLWTEWMVNIGTLEEDPARNLQLPKTKRQLPNAFLTQEQVEATLNATDVTTLLGIRDRAILETFYSTAMRRNELRCLELRDLNFESRLVHIRHGKGGKERMVPIGERAAEWVQKYIVDVRPMLLRRPTEALFLTKIGNPVHLVTLGKLARQYLDAAGITRVGGCHMFRHAAATQMMENGADVCCLQELLGHASLSTTQVYTHVTIKHLCQVHDQTHPARPDTLEPKDKQ